MIVSCSGCTHYHTNSSSNSTLLSDNTTHITFSYAQTINDYAISIEHEDGLMPINEGMEKAVAFLKPILIGGGNAEMWWL